MNNTASVFSEEQTRALARLKAYFPYRIVWGAINVQTEPHEFVTGADSTRRRLNSYLRKGWLVCTYGS